MADAPVNYKDTLNLPQTAFPMKANLPQREPVMLAQWEDGKLYEQIQAARKDAPLFVLWLVAVVVIVGALSFLPALALGPIVEQLLLGRGVLF